MKPSVAALASIACLMLSACASTGGVVADSMPTWIGRLNETVVLLRLVPGR